MQVDAQLVQADVLLGQVAAVLGEHELRKLDVVLGHTPAVGVVALDLLLAGRVGLDLAEELVRTTRSFGALRQDVLVVARVAPNADFNSRGLHDQIRESWNLDSVFGQLPGSFDPNDFGSLNRVVAQTFPNDQIAYTAYTRDYNYSRFSYERFLDPDDQETVLSFWHEDQDNLDVLG